jgi:hypothetical protein
MEEQSGARGVSASDWMMQPKPLSARQRGNVPPGKASQVSPNGNGDHHMATDRLKMATIASQLNVANCGDDDQMVACLRSTLALPRYLFVKSVFQIVF